MKSESSVHPFWKWAWRVLWGVFLMLCALIPLLTIAFSLLFDAGWY